MLRVVKFYTEYRIGKDPRDWVLVAPKGEDFDRTQTPHRVANLDPARFPPNKRAGSAYDAAVARWEVIGPAYEAWKAGLDVPETGTPLAAWPGVTPEMAEALRAMDVRTVEDVRDMGDGVAGKLRIPNARQLSKLAADYLSGEAVAEKDAKMAALQEQVEALSDALNNQPPPAAPKPKRGPGRPRKQPAEESAA